MIVIAKYMDGDVSTIHEVERVHIKDDVMKIDFKKDYFQRIRLREVREVEIFDQKRRKKVESTKSSTLL